MMASAIRMFSVKELLKSMLRKCSGLRAMLISHLSTWYPCFQVPCFISTEACNILLLLTFLAFSVIEFRVQKMFYLQHA